MKKGREEYSENNYPLTKSDIGISSKDTIRNIKEINMRIRQTPLRSRHLGPKEMTAKSKDAVEESKDVY
jgi:hypothetical protein